MILENIVSDPSLHNQIRSGLSHLHITGVFGALMENGNRRAHLTPGNADLTSAALAASWHDGYNDALDDLYNFFERFILPAAHKDIKPDFGALEKLFKNKEITEEEYAKLRSST